MHGRLKVRTSAEEAARKKKEQDLKVKAYRSGMTKILEKRRTGELDAEMLNLTGLILSRNPDVYTLWNIRKETLMKISSEMDDETKQPLFEKDLGFAEQCLMVNPKSYGAWHHRHWILDNCPVPNWNREVQLCTKYLKLDERNFHCWDYRRMVAAKADVTSADELNFCTEKIRNNFSNYSSWHYRSKLLPILHPHESDSARPLSEAILKKELEMVLTAAFTDPNDSSAWFYQRWLLGYSKPEPDFAAFRISKKQAVVTFTTPINLKDSGLKTSFEFEINPWRSLREQEYDNVWIAEGDFQLPDSGSHIEIECYLDGNVYKLPLKTCTDGFYGIKCPKFEYEFGSAVIEELKTQLDSCNQLLEYEPDSKWTLLTAALLMRAIDRKGYHSHCEEFLKQLTEVDPLREGYYEDLASKWNIENVLENWINSSQSLMNIDLSKHELTCICYEQYLSIFDGIDFSENSLASRVLPKISAFQFVKTLDVSKNALTKLNDFPELPNLEAIKYDGNSLDYNAEVLLERIFDLSLH